MVTIVIPQKGQRHLTNRAVSQIREYESNFAKILVIDDDRDQRPMHSKCQLILNEGEGWTDAVNTGIALADASSPVLLLNNDIEVSGPFIRRFADAEQTYGKVCLLGAKMRAETSLGAMSRILPRPQWLEGWCLWIPGRVRDAVPFFDTRMKMYFSDLDYQMCCNASEVPIAAVSGLPIKHIGRQTTQHDKGSKERWKIDQYAFIRKWEDA